MEIKNTENNKQNTKLSPNMLIAASYENSLNTPIKR